MGEVGADTVPSRLITVLLASGNVGDASLASQELESAGYVVIGAASGEGAMSSFREKRPDIVLLDMELLCAADVFSLAATLRSEAAGRWVPMLFLTNWTCDATSMVKGLEVGGVDFIQRPLVPQVIHAKVKMLAEWIRAKEVLESSQLRIKMLLDNMLDGVIVTDDRGYIREFNSTAQSITGWPASEAIGNPVTKIMPLEVRKMFEPSGVLRFPPKELRGSRKNGSEYPMEVRVGSVDLANERLFTVSFRDVSELQKRIDVIERMAHYDALTGLPNRSHLMEKIKHFISLSNRYRRLFAVMFIDLDYFKAINDTVGHATGDVVLKEIANRLRSCVRDSDAIGRLGGDEFMALLYDLRSPDDARIVAERIITACTRPVQTDNGTFNLGASLGIAIYPDDGMDAETLMKCADQSMYQSKQNGRSQYTYYCIELDRSVQEKMEIKNGLQRALEHKEFILHYQPQIDLNTRKIVGAEALIRWQTPAGMMPPGKFIPVAEESGSIVRIGEWALRQACAEAKRWLDMGLNDGKGIMVGVNLSVKQFDNHLPGLIFQILRETGLPPHLLDLEITESFLMKDVEQGVAILRQISEAGCHISVDDFGTGYCSLSYLKSLPVNRIKVDRAFVCDIENENNQAVIETIVTLAQKTRRETLAEGVETHEQHELLKRLGCDTCQGFLFSKPVPADDFISLAEKGIDL
ncbi:putative bifunctional diguanylate cyclase/phosphodiesterase [Chromobacterium vaccinii]|uniref:putative bifunctional diguanylate cyclase/phosphodiesterase n=1 Tax=Chromobacterium vaccinii TaxID=1108595 RepID=UPI003C77F2F3